MGKCSSLDCCFRRTATRVDDNSTSSLFDADQDIPRRAVAPLNRDQVRANQRLLVSPALAILTTILAVGLINYSLHTRNALLFVTAVGVLFGALALFQFHCLDCGQIGWYVYSGNHACPSVVQRCRQEARSGPGLRPRTQFILWVYAICTALLGYVLFILTRL